MTRIIISDEYGQHGIDIKTAIVNAYGGGGLNPIEDQIEIISGWSAAYNRAVSDENIIALIRSTAGVAGYVTQAEQIYPRVQTFFPLGSNTFEQLTNLTSIPVIITCGAGDTNFENRNNTGYGLGLEFWDNDLVQSADGDASSFANGFILGKLLKIKDTLSCSWWEARFRARMTASRSESNRETTPWDLRNGYGIIDVDAAIAYTGMIATDSYLVPAILPTYYANESVTFILSPYPGFTGSNVTVTIAAGTVYSPTSIQEANAIALSRAKDIAEPASDWLLTPVKGLEKIVVSDYGVLTFHRISLVALSHDKAAIEIEQYIDEAAFDSGKKYIGLRSVSIPVRPDVVPAMNAMYLILRELLLNDAITKY
ncbi:hypothetical protein ANAEL_01681 [Anaerolineales bacterium]|nr:hypothetical protein ANAEL_01681 [Anaerolineales bacterium]